MTTRAAGLCAAVLLAIGLGGAADARGPAPLEPASLLTWRWVADPQVSPDGRRVAYVVQSVADEGTKYAGDIWVTSTDGGEARPLVTNPANDRSPRWSPDGRTLAFLSNRSGKTQVWILESEGEPWQLTDSITDVGGLAWSPDGRRIAVVGNPPKPGEERPDYKPPHQVVFTTERLNVRNDGSPGFRTDDIGQIFTVALPADRTRVRPVQITHDRFDHGDLQWSADGRTLYFTANDKGDEQDYVRFDTEILSVPADGSSAPVRWTDRRGGDDTPRLSPDGRTMAWIGNDVDVHALKAYDPERLYIRPVAGGEARWVRIPGAAGDGVTTDSSPPRQPNQGLQWSRDGRFVYFRGAWEGRAHLYRLDVRTLKVELASKGFDGDLQAFSVGGANGVERIAALYATPTTPGDLYLVGSAGPRRLTGVGAADVAGAALGEVQERWVNSFDGQRIQYWIVTPPNFDRTRKYPAILYIHGGPHAMYGRTFFHEFQVLANAGYVVVYGNPRGSTGYGGAFGNVIQHRYPGDDAKDLLATLDDATSLGFIDDHRLGVAGGSGGGVLSSWLIGMYPDRFQASLVERAVLDWRQMMGSDIPLIVGQSWFDKFPWEDPEQYRARSSISLVDRVKTPVLIIHNGDDYRVPIGQALDYYGSLKAMHKTAKLAVFPNSSHGMSRDGTPEQRVARLELIVEWFDRWLKPDGE
jgi:acylaminoacyl-peptidase